MEVWEVKCPGCDTVLVIDRKTGKLLESRKPILEESSGDRFEDARQRVLTAKERAEKRFADAKKRESEKYSKLDALFKEKAEELRDQPIERPEHPMDRD